jgi:uncharacterized protein (UPF0371 family)
MPPHGTACNIPLRTPQNYGALDTLIALSISATTNPTAQLAMEKLKELRGCEMHITHIPTPGDETGLRRLGLNVTCDPAYATRSLFVA